MASSAHQGLVHVGRDRVSSGVARTARDTHQFSSASITTPELLVTPAVGFRLSCCCWPWRWHPCVDQDAVASVSMVQFFMLA